MAKKAAAQPDYLSQLGISPDTLQQISAYYAPGGGFAQSMAQEMVPTGQGGYTAAPAYQTTPGVPISYPITTAPIQTQQPQPAPTPPQPPPPPAASMNWSGLASSLQSMLAPYLSGASNAGAAGNPMAQIMPQLMSSLGGYLGTLQPTQAGQQAAASQTPLGTQTTPQANMNWGALGQQLQNIPGSGSGQQTQGQLLNSLLGYLGTMPSAQTTG